MEFFIGSPFSTPVGQCIERATDGSLQTEDWTLNMEICDIINETEEGPKDAIKALKKRLSGNKNYREVMLALTILETCVKNCGHRFHVLVANRDFIDGILVKIVLPKNNPPAIVQDKVLGLIQAWADAFRSSPDLTGVVHIYEELKRKGMEFPMADLDALSPIHTPGRLQIGRYDIVAITETWLKDVCLGELNVQGYTVYRKERKCVPEVDPAMNKPVPQSLQKASSTKNFLLAPSTLTGYSVPQSLLSRPITANVEQLARLRSELDVVRGNTKVMSEMLTETVPGEENQSDLELLQELNRTCRAMQQRIVELLSNVTNEEITKELLHVNDDLNNVFLRYERFERCRTGCVSPNTEDSVLNEVTDTDNLIDLGPGSPAVVSPMVGNMAAPSLSSQLAGLDLGTDSVSGTLSSLPNCHLDTHDSANFDMFPQTRSCSLADQHQNVMYTDSQSAGGLATTLEDQENNATETGDEAEEGVTSEEFDKFLEERAKAAERVPSLPPSTSSNNSPSPLPGANMKKQDRSKDALFAL
ncbi:TOM1-like protein 2 isoform X2 [Mobula birostris]|uniref:TOM1-like protein 2 isoform X2 n=1 Tax=Mobula birostris TaxID=1983395 RepID=UPI003B280AA9